MILPPQNHVCAGDLVAINIRMTDQMDICPTHQATSTQMLDQQSFVSHINTATNQEKKAEVDQRKQGK